MEFTIKFKFFFQKDLSIIIKCKNDVVKYLLNNKKLTLYKNSDIFINIIKIKIFVNIKNQYIY